MIKDFILQSDKFFEKVQEINTPFQGMLYNVFNHLLKDCKFNNTSYIKLPDITTYYISQKYNANNMSIIDRTSVIYFKNKPLFLVSSIGFIYPLNVNNRFIKIIDKDLYKTFCNINELFNFKKENNFSSFIPPEMLLYYKLSYSEIIAKIHTNNCYINMNGILKPYNFIKKIRIEQALESGFLTTVPKSKLFDYPEEIISNLYFEKITPNLGKLT